MAKRGFGLLLRRRVVELSFAWAAGFCRLAGDHERLDSSLKGFHYIAFACIMAHTCAKPLMKDITGSIRYLWSRVALRGLVAALSEQFCSTSRSLYSSRMGRVHLFRQARV